MTTAIPFEPHAIHTQSLSAGQAEASVGVSDPPRMNRRRDFLINTFFSGESAAGLRADWPGGDGRNSWER
jgi:hypothetical protein